MLISALLSTIDDDHYIRLLLTNNDLKFLLGHFVNFFLNMGIIRPVEEGNGSDNFMVIPLTKREPLAENQWLSGKLNFQFAVGIFLENLI